MQRPERAERWLQSRCSLKTSGILHGVALEVSNPANSMSTSYPWVKRGSWLRHFPQVRLASQEDGPVHDGRRAEDGFTQLAAGDDLAVLVVRAHHLGLPALVDAVQQPPRRNQRSAERALQPQLAHHRAGLQVAGDQDA